MVISTSLSTWSWHHLIALRWWQALSLACLWVQVSGQPSPGLLAANALSVLHAPARQQWRYPGQHVRTVAAHVQCTCVPAAVVRPDVVKHNVDFGSIQQGKSFKFFCCLLMVGQELFHPIGLHCSPHELVCFAEQDIGRHNAITSNALSLCRCLLSDVPQKLDETRTHMLLNLAELAAREFEASSYILVRPATLVCLLPSLPNNGVIVHAGTTQVGSHMVAFNAF